jgi:RNA polymerase sigma factor (TIGR02999 family)
MGQSPRSVVQMLATRAAGDTPAAVELLPVVYAELRKLARSRLAKLAAGQTLQPTALVHEAYLRLVGSGDPGWNGRGHFFGAAAQAMRDILVEHVRTRRRLKRGGDRQRFDLSHIDVAGAGRSVDLLDLDEALRRLEREDARKGQIVNLRYFAGLSPEEIAEILGVSLSTVEREWRYIRAWLFSELCEARA